ncbi:MAG: hypothetical protein M1536_01825 [Firmicutes bacterium]|nr:hypothetical protein [Bacillota bacterium]
MRRKLRQLDGAKDGVLTRGCLCKAERIGKPHSDMRLKQQESQMIAIFT